MTQSNPNKEWREEFEHLFQDKDKYLIGSVLGVEEFIEKQIEIARKEGAREAQTNAVVWTIGIINGLHLVTEYSNTTDRLLKGLKNNIRDRYKAKTGIDPAPNYPVKAKLIEKIKQ